MLAILSIRRLLTTSAAVLISLALSHSEAAAQRGATPQTGGAGAGAGGGGAGAGGGVQAPQPGNTQANEIGRAAERRFMDAGEAGAAGGMAAMRGMGAMGGMRGAGGMGGFGGMNPFGANPFGANNAAAQPKVRLRLQGQVEVPAQQRQAALARNQQQLRNSQIRRLVNGFDVSLDQGVATINGVAATAKDKRMAELMLKLEPGVRQVDNQIVVAE
ncbi:MAG: BON domain-containing protein [Planctomycetaceae bacterium]|nr:MAG: BON domain-containing protein [Planctomycetaceae bacterium]